MGHDRNMLFSSHIELHTNSSECERLYRFLADGLDKLPVSMEFGHDLKLVAEELLANIINHGYAGDSGKSIDVALKADGKSVHLTFTDSASAFNPLDRESPELLNDLSEGGMGLLLVKSLTDSQQYLRDNGRNVFTVTKNYNKNKIE
jgi:serine/threonine-protein kinase RsbW